MTVYCLSQGSALAQSPAWGQLGAPGQVGGKPRPITVQYSGHVICPDQLEDSIESWRVTIAERAEMMGVEEKVLPYLKSTSL